MQNSRDQEQNTRQAGSPIHDPESSLSRGIGAFGGDRDARFQTTRWTLVANAAGGQTREAGDALAELYRRYWYPLFAWLRGKGRSRPDAEDITQGFFCRLLEKDWLLAADREKGKLRTFLLTALKRYAANQSRHAGAKKRGGDVQHIDLDFEDGEARYLDTLEENESPDKLFDRQWATTLLCRVTRNLRDFYADQGKEDRYEVMKEALMWKGQTAPYAEMAKSMGLSENAARQAVSRMRRKYRRLLVDEVRDTLETDDPKAVEDELIHLSEVFAS